ncbi:MAG: hypothetical protein K6B38_02600 [Ruminococcus sp.]|nr:hypothetical protein [Ruminococcus sp.]
MNRHRTSVRLQKQYVEKFRNKNSFNELSEIDKYELTKFIAPLITSTDTDEYAKRFDNFMYEFMLAHLEQLPTLKYMKGQLILTAELLEKKSAIPQIQQKMSLIKDIQNDSFWENMSILTMENVRKELRDLMRFLVGGDNQLVILLPW